MLNIYVENLRDNRGLKPDLEIAIAYGNTSEGWYIIECDQTKKLLENTSIDVLWIHAKSRRTYADSGRLKTTIVTSPSLFSSDLVIESYKRSFFTDTRQFKYVRRYHQHEKGFLRRTFGELFLGESYPSSIDTFTGIKLNHYPPHTDVVITFGWYVEFNSYVDHGHPHIKH